VGGEGQLRFDYSEPAARKERYHVAVTPLTLTKLQGDPPMIPAVRSPLLAAFLGILALMGGTSCAVAQEMAPVPQAPVPPAPVLQDTGASDGCPPTCDRCNPWSGTYFGFQVGYAWGQGDTAFDALPSAAQFINLASTTLTPEPNGFFGGLHAGFNWQRNRLVLGGVADFNWSDLSGSQRVSPIVQNNGTPFDGFLEARQRIDWFGTVRGRAGIASDRVLVYGTAGFAFGHVDYSALADFRPQGSIQYPASLTRGQGGWTAGGGIEIVLSRHVTWKTEYLYFDLGSETVTVDPVPANPPFQVRNSWDTTGHTITTGLSFHF